jgi:dTDP-4-amino-4,6-dideoxygalactose transaminase
MSANASKVPCPAAILEWLRLRAHTLEFHVAENEAFLRYNTERLGMMLKMMNPQEQLQLLENVEKLKDKIMIKRRLLESYTRDVHDYERQHQISEYEIGMAAIEWGEWIQGKVIELKRTLNKD